MKGRITAPAFPPAGGRAGGGETIATPAPPAPPPPLHGPHGRCGRSASPRRRMGPRLLPRAPSSAHGRGPQPRPSPAAGTGGHPGRCSAPSPPSPSRSGGDFVDFRLPGHVDSPSYRKPLPAAVFRIALSVGVWGNRPKTLQRPPRLPPSAGSLWQFGEGFRGVPLPCKRRVGHPDPRTRPPPRPPAAAPFARRLWRRPGVSPSPRAQSTLRPG